MTDTPDSMQPRASRVRYVVLLGLCLAAMLAYVHRTCFGSAATTIRGEAGISEEDMSLAMGAFFIFYALFQIPTGLLVESWGPRKSLLLFGLMGACTLALASGTLLVGATAAFVVILISRALMGIAQAGLFPASTRCFANWFPLRQRGFATGTLQASMSAGGFLGFKLTPEVLKAVYWPFVFIAFAIPGVIWSLWFFWYFRDRPADHRSVNAGELEQMPPPPPTASADSVKPRTPWLRLFTSNKVVWICIPQFFRAAAFGFWMTWCPTYLQTIYQLTPAQASNLAAWPFVGAILGSFGGGMIVDRVLRATGSRAWSRKGVSMISATIGSLLFVLVVNNPPYLYPAAFGSGALSLDRPIPGPAVLATGILSLAAFFTACGNPCAYSITIDVGGKYAAIVFGAMNMMGNFGTGLYPIAQTWWNSSFGWVTAPYFVGLLYFLGVLCWIPLKVRGTVLEDDKPPSG